ncbi:ABC transporter, CydDC cysteine exporter (CydDC-E) family, permease/ATP-binding protein CydD [Beutenbergia cavernae DSM 12333]|uniref:ABC transporter, CydDC cysteine exporter (CydDC-E) family, permease/ATP-binding protein CydD n=1 Tax=Beutenbergia cavernae (strain ATCC BAA-8 / DSM 12333 / CCUG 43141 / JCM 11478 / NBRC 16432 / NCIMB 13614 / HKI 0122) TaxID=471853 RepID=C5C3H2_BEUC1|nr:thiol reductant ABC exporter subunit CydD [Beutenbergia cavernae]ACQ79871.1 ABC transporter, CydDC cysteine exporter (CydDC-E) family, permease/ATP-binding protein CydD [Beutenbergia cavernae DSM 12333]
MKPLDPRLLREARSVRGWVLASAAFAIGVTACVVVSAFAIAQALAPVVSGTATLADVRTPLVVLAVAVVARAVLAWAAERTAHASAAQVIGELRGRLLDHATRLPHRWRTEHGAGVVVLATRGLDDLEPYLVRYLPQLLLAATLTPATLAVVLTQDLLSGLLLAFTLPLVPLFMWLVGVTTATFARGRLAVLERQGAQLLDLLAGLTTLRALGREVGPGTRVRRLGEAYRRTTMSTLRVAFLSGGVLELLATLGVALVAVGIGLRLVEGDLTLVTGLTVLVLAPEVYLPLRMVGTHFHASADGVAAAERTFAVLDEPLPASGTLPVPDWSRIEVRGLGVRAGERGYWAPRSVDAVIRPGEILALAGPSGSGKTTTAMAMLGLQPADAGGVRLVDDSTPTGEAGTPLEDVDPAAWWAQVAWVPQRPSFGPGSVAERAGGTSDHVVQAAAATGLDRVVARRGGWTTALGQGGTGLTVGVSVGESQRLALTAALARGARLVVVDEPTAHLDPLAEAEVLAALRGAADAGAAVVVIAHRPTTLAAADHVVRVDGG